MTKHHFDDRPPRPGRINTPGTGARSMPEHYFRICQWALLKGGTFTARELHERFGISLSTCHRYVREWQSVFGTKVPVIRRAKAAPAPVKLTLDELLKG